MISCFDCRQCYSCNPRIMIIWRWMLVMVELLTLTAPALSMDDDRVRDFKLNLHRLLEGSRIRKRRAAQESYESGNFQMRVGSSAQEDLPYLSDYRPAFWLSVRHQGRNQVLVGTEEGHLILFEFSGADDKDARTIALSRHEVLSTTAKAFSHYEDQWFIVQQFDGARAWIRLYERVGRGLEGRQFITFHGAASFDAITIKGMHYLAVVTYQSSLYQDTLLLYEWRKTQFDIVATRVVAGARSVACWVLDGSLFVGTAHEQLGTEGDLAVGSQVFLYDSREESGLVLRDVLSTNGSRKILHFYVGGHHYILFTGSYDAAIYWWLNDQFLLWQTLEHTAHASDASILALENGEIVIVIALQEEIWYMTQDASGHYKKTFTMRISDFRIASLHFMFSGKAYYALALFEKSAKQHPYPIWKLKFNEFFIPSTRSLDVLPQCLVDTRKVLEDRQSELNAVHADLDRVWLKNKEQYITAEIFVNGESFSKLHTTVRKIIVLTKRKFLPDCSIHAVERKIHDLEDVEGDLKNIMARSVYKSTEQVIDGVISFQEPPFIPSLNLESTDQDVTINKLPVSFIKEHALKKDCDQIFSYAASLGDVYSRDVFVTHLNGVHLKDFLQLKGEQRVTGDLVFFNVKAKSVESTIINSIPIHTFVTSAGEQQITDLKVITQFSAAVVDVHSETNGERLNDLSSKIHLIDRDGQLDGKYSLESTVVIKGDLFFTKLNGGRISFEQLVLESVDKYSDQELQGAFVMKYPLSTNSLELKGKLNNIYLDQLLTKNTKQNITGDIIFSQGLKVLGNLDVQYVNDHNLASEAVSHVSDTKFVSGFKTFKNTVFANTINMREYVTLDGVDPSLLVQDLIKHTEGTVYDNVVFHDVVVTGNVIAEGVNQWNISDLPNTVWRKSVDQTIDTPVHVKRMILRDDLHVREVNNLNVETELVSSYKDEVILSVKSFAHNITVVNNMDTKSGAMVNGMDIVSFKQEKSDYVNLGTVRGKKTLSHFEIFGDLRIEDINDMQFLKNVMRPDEYQIVNGPINFSSEMTMISDDLRSANVKSNLINNRDLQQFIKDAPTTKSPPILKNKQFSKVKGKSLYLEDDSLLQGVSFPQMIGRAVMLNTAQTIQSGQVFLDAVHFRGTVDSKTLNGQDLTEYVKRVVLKDVKQSIQSTKTFNRIIQVQTNFTVKGLINGVDIDKLNKAAFMKSSDNMMQDAVRFGTHISADELSVPDSLIDNVKWEDLIYLNAEGNLGPVTFLSDTYTQDVFVNGLVNDCDLFQLRDKAIYAKHENQTIREALSVGSIEVIGNLHLKTAVNDVVVDELRKMFVSVSQDQVIDDDIDLGSNVTVVNFSVKDQIGGVDLQRMMQDAVRHSIPQTIHGHKNFNSEVYSDILVTPEVSLVEINGVVFNDLFDKAVWKHYDQKIHAEKTFADFHSSNVKVNGYLNYLKLPSDIVRTDTSEVIPGEMIMMTDTILRSDMVIHGKLNDMDIEDLIHSRVDLTSDGPILSATHFADDVIVFENLGIHGMVNDIALEMIARVDQSLPLDGLKVFMEDTRVLGAVFSSLVNGFDLDQLAQNILSYKNPEKLTELQSFEKPVQVKSTLFADWINSVSISDTFTRFKSVSSTFYKTHSYLRNLSDNYQHKLNYQMETYNPTWKFAYLSLVQDLNIGPAISILNGYPITSRDQFSHSLMIWTQRKECAQPQKCCSRVFSSWAKVQRSGNILMDNSTKAGRIFPIYNPAAELLNKNFFMWTSTTGPRPKWCPNLKGETHLASFDKYGKLEVVVMSDSVTIAAIKSFWSGSLYSVIGYYGQSKGDIKGVEVYEFTQRKWTSLQTLPIYGTISMDIVHNEEGNEILLAVGTASEEYTSVYVWSSTNREFNMLQNLPYAYSTSVLWIKHGSYLLLALANVDSYVDNDVGCGDVRGGELNIFLYDKDLRWAQSIPRKGIVSLTTFNLHGDNFLIAASAELQTLFVYEWKGYAGFSQIQSIFVGEVKHINTYSIEDEIYVTVAIASGPSKVLKVVVQGKHRAVEIPKTQKIPIGEALKDEAFKEKKC